MNGPFRVGEWLVQPLHHQIGGPRGRVKIDPRVMRLLLCLAGRAPETVSREELIEDVWDGAFVTDDVLTQSVSELRKALRDDPKAPRFVTTVPKRGYRLIAPVEAGAEWDVPSPTPPSRFHSWERIAWVLAVGLVALLAWAYAPAARAPADSTPIRFAVAPPPETSSETLKISPDGRWVAFLVPNADGASQIWIHEIETGQRKILVGSDGAWHVFWSADSTSIVFSTMTELKKIEVTGSGESETIWEHGFWWGGSWSDDGVLVLSHFGELYRMDSAGGEPTRLQLDDGLQGFRVRPHVLPGGRHALYFAALSLGRGALYVASLDTGEASFLVDSDSKGIYADGHLLFIRGNALIAQRFDPDELSLEGEPRVIDHQLVSPAVVGRTDAPFSASNNGVLVFRGSSGVDGQLVWFDRNGQEMGHVPQPSTGEYVNPSLSPDGRTIAANRRDPATRNLDIWLIDVDTKVATRFTSETTPEVDPVWSPEGERIAFTSTRDGKKAIWVQNFAGGDEQILWEPPPEKAKFGILLTDWSTDGKYLLVFAGGDTIVVPVSGDGEPRVVLADTFEDDGRVRITHIYAARFSPDGEWIAYSSNETGASEVYVMRTSDGSHRQRISNAGGMHPVWRGDGRELYYWGGKDFHAPLMRVALEPEGEGLGASAPERLFQPTIAGLLDSRNNYAVTADGQRFLLRRPSPDPSPVHVIVNWTAALKER